MDAIEAEDTQSERPEILERKRKDLSVLRKGVSLLKGTRPDALSATTKQQILTVLQYLKMNLSDKERKRIQAQIKNLKTYDFNEDAARDLYPNTYKNKIDQSKILGTKILDQLKRDPFTKIHKQNVEYADFRVLKSVDIPSVLVESGFITNPEDAKRLKTKAGRRMIARSIFLGIHNYFKETPVSGSILENYPNYLNYEIQKGDVLSEIAIRFGVTVNSINKINNLENKSIYPGQIIKIEI